MDILGCYDPGTKDDVFLDKRRGFGLREIGGGVAVRAGAGRIHLDGSINRVRCLSRPGRVALGSAPLTLFLFSSGLRVLAFAFLRPMLLF